MTIPERKLNTGRLQNLEDSLCRRLEQWECNFRNFLSKIDSDKSWPTFRRTIPTWRDRLRFQPRVWKRFVHFDLSDRLRRRLELSEPVRWVRGTRWWSNRSLRTTDLRKLDGGRWRRWLQLWPSIWKRINIIWTLNLERITITSLIITSVASLLNILVII